MLVMILVLLVLRPSLLRLSPPRYLHSHVPIGLTYPRSMDITRDTPTTLDDVVVVVTRRLDLPILQKPSHKIQTYPLGNDPALAHGKPRSVGPQSPLVDFQMTTVVTVTDQESFRLEEFWLLEVFRIAVVEVMICVEVVSWFELEGGNWCCC